MRSTAHIKGHPIHPILIPFPIAFFSGAVVFDILGLVNENRSFLQTGEYLALAGIITALVTALPGIVDYFGTVPSKSSAKKRAARHGLINISAVIFFSIAYSLKLHNSSFVYILILEAIGIVLLMVGGWMGGTLSYRNQIGVDIRYAEAGKWNEVRLNETKGGVIEVADFDELKVNQMKLLKIGMHRIVLGRTDVGYVAFDDFCTHKGGTLAGGAMMCGTVQCPWHGSQFEVATGNVKAGPAKKKIKTYLTEERGGKVYLSL